MRHPARAALGLALVALLSVPVFTRLQTLPFSLAVVRADGVLLPFAHWDDGRWTTEWPLPPKRVEIPITLDAVPAGWWPDDTPELEWNLWTFDGEARRIRATEPFLTPVYCGAVIQLRTSFRPQAAPPPLGDQPYPKVGLATTGDVVVEPIGVVEPGSDDWNRLEARLVEPFDRSETSTIRRARLYGWRFPAETGDRTGRPRVTLEAVYRAPHETPGTIAYFFEVSRRYELRDRAGDGACDMVAFAWGWALAEPGRDLTVTLNTHVTDCRREGVTVMFPLGLVRLGRRVLWVAQWSGWEEETYAVVEVPRDLETKTLIRTQSGSCW